MKRKDHMISERLREEIFSLPGSNVEIGRRIGCCPRMISDWTAGRHTPSAYHLKGMYEAGLDVIYILTGKRTR